MLDHDALNEHMLGKQKEGTMKAFIASVAFAIVVAAGAAMVLEQQQQSAASAYSTSGARVGDPGHNLIGK
jgi:hypothetical protein